jgi:hypothetical protein
MNAGTSDEIQRPYIRSLHHVQIPPRAWSLAIQIGETMHRIKQIIIASALLACAVPVLAHEGHQMSGEKAVKKTVTGEVVDMGCWLGHGARGEKHISCATKCLNEGMPMGILTSNGTLYLVTLDHDNADPYNSLKGMAGESVSVTGELLSRSGMKAITATTVQAAGK